MPTAHETEADEAARCGGPRAYTLADFPAVKTGEQLVEAWIKKDPALRWFEVHSRLDGRITVVLVAGSRRFQSDTQVTLDAAYRTAVMIAMAEGER